MPWIQGEWTDSIYFQQYFDIDFQMMNFCALSYFWTPLGFRFMLCFHLVYIFVYPRFVGLNLNYSKFLNMIMKFVCHFVYMVFNYEYSHNWTWMEKIEYFRFLCRENTCYWNKQHQLGSEDPTSVFTQLSCSEYLRFSVNGILMTFFRNFCQTAYFFIIFLKI